MTSIFSTDEIEWLDQRSFRKIYRGKEREYVKCLIRDKDILLKPEERVRQLWLYRLIKTYKYPKHRIFVEYPITFGTDTSKSADIVIVDEYHPDNAFCVIETKKEKRTDGRKQLESYAHATGAPLAMWSNGENTEIWHRKNPNRFISIHQLPSANQTIDEIVNEPWYISTLIEREEKRERQGNRQITLRDLIVEMENTVLANSGVDVFEEVFKLIFMKLYDEIYSHQNNTSLRFRYINTAEQMHKSLSTLFEQAKEKWPGVFSEDALIELDPDHLQVCVSSLEDWKLFNSNLDVIDDAFEYLVSKSAKGEKGQFFTPRWVIEMCVRMLNPTENESLIDPACGSSGFLIHSMFYVWEQIIESMGHEKNHLFAMEEKPPRCREYVSKKVFGIDFDEKVVRVSRCLNLIAGDGETNVLHLNSLDWNNWEVSSRQNQWSDVYGNGWSRLRKLMTNKRKDDYRQFHFDVCMANPPFSGQIKQSKILSRYDLARKENGKTQDTMPRDILFLERNLALLKPGGRMAIVLPQGRTNNPSDSRLRSYISEKCRILAVVELHPNTFKPHTGIKTSVLFLQKWNDDESAGALCPKKANYNIFFARQQLAPVNNAGKKNYLEKNKIRLRDAHHHFIVQHDLYNHEGLTHDGVAEEFCLFAYQEGMSFVSKGKPQLSHPVDSDQPLTYSSDFLDVSKVRRIDAKYFSPYFINLQKIAKSRAVRTRVLGEFLVENNRGVQPKYVENGEVCIINSGNILEGYLDYEGFERTGIDFWEKNKKARVCDGDILMYTTGANIGRTAIFKGTDKALASNHVNILRIKEEDPVYIAFVLNSMLGRMQTKRWCSGSGQAEIYPADIENYEIPFVSDVEQREIVRMLVNAERNRKKSFKVTKEANRVWDDIFLFAS